MSNYNTLKTTIDANIKQNGVQAITGQILNSVLNLMVTSLGAGYQFAGFATTATDPGSPDAKVFYIATDKGTYTKFGGISVTAGDIIFLYWDSSWHKIEIQLDGVVHIDGEETITGQKTFSDYTYFSGQLHADDESFFLGPAHFQNGINVVTFDDIVNSNGKSISEALNGLEERLDNLIVIDEELV